MKEWHDCLRHLIIRHSFEFRHSDFVILQRAVVSFFANARLVSAQERVGASALSRCLRWLRTAERAVLNALVRNCGRLCRVIYSRLQA